MRQPQESAIRAAFPAMIPAAVRVVMEYMTANDGAWRVLAFDATPSHDVAAWRMIREEDYNVPRTLMHAGCCVPAGRYTFRRLLTGDDGSRRVPDRFMGAPVIKTVALEETERYVPEATQD